MYKLNKALYRLLKASREWCNHLHDFLMNMVCESFVADATLYFMVQCGNFIFLVKYVQDIPMYADRDEMFDLIISTFKESFELVI